MIRFLRTLLLLAACGYLVMAYHATSAFAQTNLKTDKDKVSYGFGLNFGRDMLRDGIAPSDLDFDLMVAGLKDALADKPLPINEKDFGDAYNAYIIPKLTERAKLRNEAYL